MFQQAPDAPVLKAIEEMVTLGKELPTGVLSGNSDIEFSDHCPFLCMSGSGASSDVRALSVELLSVLLPARGDQSFLFLSHNTVFLVVVVLFCII